MSHAEEVCCNDAIKKLAVECIGWDSNQGKFCASTQILQALTTSSPTVIEEVFFEELRDQDFAVHIRNCTDCLVQVNSDEFLPWVDDLIEQGESDIKQQEKERQVAEMTCVDALTQLVDECAQFDVHDMECWADNDRVCGLFTKEPTQTELNYYSLEREYPFAIHIRSCADCQTKVAAQGFADRINLRLDQSEGYQRSQGEKQKYQREELDCATVISQFAVLCLGYDSLGDDYYADPDKLEMMIAPEPSEEAYNFGFGLREEPVAMHIRNCPACLAIASASDFKSKYIYQRISEIEAKRLAEFPQYYSARS